MPAVNSSVTGNQAPVDWRGEPRKLACSTVRVPPATKTWILACVELDQARGFVKYRLVEIDPRSQRQYLAGTETQQPGRKAAGPFTPALDMDEDRLRPRNPLGQTWTIASATCRAEKGRSSTALAVKLGRPRPGAQTLVTTRSAAQLLTPGGGEGNLRCSPSGPERLALTCWIR